MRRVVITGLGVICSLGRDKQQFWQSIESVRSGVLPLECARADQLAFKNGGQVRGFDPAEYFESREERMFDPFAQFQLISADEALADAGIEWTGELRDRTAVITGSSLAGQTTEDGEYYKLYAENRERFHPFTIPRCMANAGASQISMRHGLRGPAMTLSTACSSSNHALGTAFWLIRNGVADAAVTGGSEALFAFGNLKAWDALRVVAPDTCRPFSKDREGMVLGEGGATLVLETLDAALARGAHIYAEVAGFGMTADASHITKPSVAGPARAMQAALDDAGLAPGDIDYINAHGTGTPVNDPNEVRAIRAVFGGDAERLAVSSTKALHGHTLGAAGGIEAVATALAIHNAVVPPTANYTEPDPECDLDVVPNEPRPCEIRGALSNSFAFGGLNASVAFRRLDEGASS